MESKLFLERYFLELKHLTGLFYEWQPAIRFELGDSNEQNKRKYIEGSIHRADTLYKELHIPDDDCIVMMDVFERNLNRKNLSPFINRHNRFRIVMSSYKKDDATYYRFEAACKAKEIAHVKLLRAIINADLGIKPSIPHRVSILNKRTQTVFHVYDDRGCDDIAINKEIIRPLYEQYYDWILQYDKAAIIHIFEK